jgi:uncharacterized protein YndB with AHSA1/START domain/DNA-binding transcriptional ArsR family regulator
MSERELDAVWSALASPKRRRILDLLRDGPRTTGQLAEAFEVSRFAVMKHLGVLEEAGVDLVRRRGRQRWNHLNAVPLRRAYDHWVRPLADRWATSLTALQRTAESEPSGEQRGATTMEIEHMQVVQEVQIAAPPERVWSALTEELSEWWGEGYRLSDESERLVLEARPGGEFREEWPGGGALWATVAAVTEGRQLWLDGDIGMRGPVKGFVHIDLEPHGDGTRLSLVHEAVGVVRDGLQEDYEGGWRELLEVRLKRFVEEGVRTPVA